MVQGSQGATTGADGGVEADHGRPDFGSHTRARPVDSCTNRVSPSTKQQMEILGLRCLFLGFELPRVVISGLGRLRNQEGVETVAWRNA